jgi:uncharacterized membrane protein
MPVQACTVQLIDSGLAKLQVTVLWVADTCKGLSWNGSLSMCATKCRLDGTVHVLQISRRELENIQQGKGKITRLHTKLSRLTQVGS